VKQQGYVGAMKLATLGVTDLNASLKLFNELMELEIEDRGSVSDSLLKAWGLKSGISAEFAELSCKGYPIGRLRLVEFDPKVLKKVRVDFGENKIDQGTDIGIKAIDFYVKDPIKPYVKKIQDAGYKFRSLPVKHNLGKIVSEECVFSGPDDVPILIMVGHSHAITSMRPGSPDGPFSEIPTVSVVAGDLEETRRFYQEGLGLIAVTDTETPEEYRDKVNDLTGVPSGTRIHFLMWAKEGEASGKILCVHFFDQTGERLKNRMKPGNLGFSLLTHETDNIHQLHKRLSEMGFVIIKRPSKVESRGLFYQHMLVEGPNEELFEFIEN